jgi:hypothetical protein
VGATEKLLVVMLATLCADHAGASFLGSERRDCIPRHSVRDETAESETSLIFHGKGGRAYRNTLPAPCDGLTSLNNLGKLGLRSKDDDLLCAGDLVWLEQKGLFSASDSNEEAACKLGTFESISEMSLSEFLRR